MTIVGTSKSDFRARVGVPVALHRPVWGEYPIAVFSHPDSFEIMEPTCSTDYFAFIPRVPVIGFVEPDKKSGTIRHLTNAVVADLALVALAVTSGITVALVILNWSR
jgi:hypothetical protein